MGIRAVIWDIGGVLVRTEDHEPRRRQAERLGLTREELVHLVFDSEMGQKAQLGAVNARELLEYVCREVRLPSEDAASFEQEFFSGDRLDVDLVDTIRSLQKHYRTGIISNAWDDVREMILDRWKIADAFDQIILSAEVKICKPDPRIYQIALQRLEIAPDEAVFIDDFSRNIDGARAVGMHAIRFLSAEQIQVDLDAFLEEA
jgi:epoxide hydrolase-like predicted phosphatase